MENTILHGAYYAENFGDELLFALQGNWIKEASKGNVILPFAIEEYKKQVNALDIDGYKGIQQAQKLVYGGGGYFGEPNHQVLKWGIKFFKKKHTVPGRSFKKRNLSYIIVGVGVGPITNLLTRKAMVKLCKNASLLVVRDNESKEYLIKYGVPEKQIQVTTDQVLSMKLSDISKDKMEEAKAVIGEITSDQKVLGIHLGVNREDPHYGDNIKALTDTLIKYLKDNKNIVPLLIADKRNSKIQNKAIDYISSKIDDTKVYKHSDVWTTCAVLSQIDTVITTKLHVGITSYVFGTKVLSVATHQKTQRFYNQIGGLQTYLFLNDFEEEKFNSMLHKITSSKFEEIYDIDKREELHALALKNKELILDYVKS